MAVAVTVPGWLRAPDQVVSKSVLDWTLVATVCATLLFWRAHPVAACAYALVATGVFYVISPIDGPLIVVVLLGVYRVAASGRLLVAVLLGVLIVVAGGVASLAGSDDINGVALLMMAGWVVALVALGFVRWTRQEALRAAVERAEERALRRATEERLRIARELHDVVGHHLSMINVQAGTALHRFERHPERAEAALGVIKEASRDTLRELRSTLGVLRQVDDAAPMGGLERLDELVRYAELAGLRVSAEVVGEARRLRADVDLAAYRILQESITNVTRHAAAGQVRLRVTYGTSDLRLEVEDDGKGSPGAAGTGIRGMSERARALGGDLAAGPLRDGGFRVRARLPYGESG
ncbi:sensor histidine kinase [Spirillospora sp. CA-294931]|uniref:sensor histidine kinase n=1 Tax=Spirillospora sp. CA-294931 TaxID=3240042 RepID=UPI003D9436BD